MFKNTAAKFMVFAFDTTTGAAKTGDAANLTAYVSKDYGAVTVLADTAATEMDATNAKGYYLFDAAQGETNGDVLMVSAKSATANISVIGAPSVIFTRPATGWLAPATAGRTLVVDASGLADANVVKVGPTGSGTAQTAGDIIGDTNDIQTRLPAALTADGNMKADTLRVGGTLQTAGDLAALLVVLATYVDTEVAAILAAVDTEVAAIKTKTDQLTFTVANVLDANMLRIAGDATAATNLKGGALALVISTCAAGSTTTVVESNLTEATDDHYNGRAITFYSGALAGQSSSVSDYNGTTKALTVVALTEAPASTDLFVIS